METENQLAIRQKALDALRESTRILKIANQLVRVGNTKEAEVLRERARRKRYVSVLLMAQAHPIDTDEEL